MLIVILSPFSRLINSNAQVIGSIDFFNPDNSDAGATTRPTVSRIIATTITSDSNADKDSGGYLSFMTKNEGEALGEKMRLINGKLGIGISSPEAILHLSAGSNSGGAPIKLTTGNLLVSPQAGAIEFDGTNLYYTDSTNTRRTIAVV